MKEDSILIDKPITVMAREPLPDVTADEIRDIIEDIDTNDRLAEVYANVDNKFFWVADEVYDYEEGTEECRLARERTKEWKELYVILNEKVLTAAREEGLLTVKPETVGFMRSMEPFMEKYGYINADGWWIKCEKEETL